MRTSLVAAAAALAIAGAEFVLAAAPAYAEPAKPDPKDAEIAQLKADEARLQGENAKLTATAILLNHYVERLQQQRNALMDGSAQQGAQADYQADVAKATAAQKPPEQPKK